MWTKVIMIIVTIALCTAMVFAPNKQFNNATVEGLIYTSPYASGVM